MNPAILELTDEMILNDIAGFEDRIAAARVKLAGLQESSPSGWKERKRLKAKRRELEGEVVHIDNLISIARSALNPSEEQPPP